MKYPKTKPFHEQSLMETLGGIENSHEDCKSQNENATAKAPWEGFVTAHKVLSGVAKLVQCGSFKTKLLARFTKPPKYT